MTKEHLLAKPIRPYLPKSPINKQRQVEFAKPQPGLYVAQNKLRDGHGFNITVRRVCETCNNVWMSGMETDTGPVLIPLISGQMVNINKTDQQMITRWAAKTAIVSTFFHRDDSVIPLSSRQWVMQKGNVGARSECHPSAR
jgi:hypothetical protein